MGDEQGHVWAKETARADPDFASVEDDEIEVEERVLADGDPAAVVDLERRFRPRKRRQLRLVLVGVVFRWREIRRRSHDPVPRAIVSDAVSRPRALRPGAVAHFLNNLTCSRRLTSVANRL
jgi:hypothetical protein